MVFKIFTMENKANESYVKISKEVLRPVDRYHSYIDFEVDLLRPVSSLYMRAQLYTCFTDCHPFLVDMTANICKFDELSSSYYLNMLHKALKMFPTNVIPGKCPYQEGTYYVQNVSSNINLLKLFPIPENTYMVSFKFYEDLENTKAFILSSKFKFRLYNENDKKRISGKKRKTISQ